MTCTNGYSVTDSDMKAITVWSADAMSDALHSLANRLDEMQDVDGLPCVVAINYTCEFDADDRLFHVVTAVVEQ